MLSGGGTLKSLWCGAGMEVIDEVRQIIAKSLRIPVENLTPETRLDEIGAESLDVIEIVFELEEKFGINIPFQANQAAKSGQPAELPFGTIGDVAKAVKDLVDAKAAT
jgi:acyl carrier protein